MHDLSHLGAKKVFIFGDGAFFITETVIWAVIVAAVLIFLALWSTRKMQRVPHGRQIIAELVVSTTYNMVQNIMGKGIGKKFAPYMGSIFLFVVVSNMLGLFGFRPVTTDVNCTFALSLATFVLVQATGIKSMGLGGKLRHMASPMKLMFPIKVIEEIALPISLGFRLFGNILGGMILMSLIYGGLATASEFFCSIPILDAVIPLPANLFFDVFEPVLQAYIFTMLSMVFITQEAVMVSAHEE